jgi:hypothetical protein
MLDLCGNHRRVRGAFDQSAEVGCQKVVDGPFPTAHAGADRFLLQVLAVGGALLPHLGVKGCGDVAHGVDGSVVAFEGNLFGILAQSACQTPEHGLLLGSAQVFTETAIALVDVLRSSLGNGQADVSAACDQMRSNSSSYI